MTSHQPAWMRAGWMFPLIFLLAAASGFLSTTTGFDVGAAAPIIFAVVVGGIWTMLTDFYVVARAGDEIVLATKSRWTNKILGIAEKYSPPVAASIDKKWFQTHAEVDGRVLTMQKSHTDRFQEVVS